MNEQGRGVWLVAVLASVCAGLIWFGAWVNGQETARPAAVPVPPVVSAPAGGDFLPFLLGERQGKTRYLVNDCPEAKPSDLLALLVPCDEWRP